MEKASQRHLFPGANTPVGFYSCFPFIISEEEAAYFYYIKGGPGTGKSTFMKHLGARVAAAGRRVEYFHCSSDPDSLDAVLFPDLKIAVIDATAPHSYDPKYPAAAGRILDMGAFWEDAPIQAHRSDIEAISKANRAAFSTAFHYLAAARPLLDEARAQVRQALAPWAADREANAILEAAAPGRPVGERRGRLRRLFATGFTPDGHRSLLDSAIAGCTKIYRITGPSGCAADLMERLTGAALAHGLDAEGFLCPLQPDGPPEHLVLPQLGTAVVTANRWHDTMLPAQTIDMRPHLQSVPDQEVLEFTEAQLKVLIDAALRSLSKSKQYHDELEACYAPYMDFGAVAGLLEKTAAEILSL